MNHKDEKQIIAKHIHGIVGGKPQFVHYNDKIRIIVFSILALVVAFCVWRLLNIVLYKIAQL